jgi:hypothetical protein
MLKLLGIVFLNLIVAVGLVTTQFLIGGDFLTEFIKNQVPQIMATAMALNIATITFLSGSLVNIERALKGDKELFKNTRSELKQNIIAMACIYVLNLFVTIFVNNNNVIFGIEVQHIVLTLSLLLTLLFGSLMLEVSFLVLDIKGFNDKKKQ